MLCANFFYYMILYKKLTAGVNKFWFEPFISRKYIQIYQLFSSLPKILMGLSEIRTLDIQIMIGLSGEWKEHESFEERDVNIVE